MKAIHVAILLLIVAATTTTGYATEKKTAATPAKDATKNRVIFKKSESHQFSGANLKGRLKKPELSYIYERKGLKEEQIVNIPENFNDEIIKGAGQL